LAEEGLECCAAVLEGQIDSFKVVSFRKGLILEEEGKLPKGGKKGGNMSVLEKKPGQHLRGVCLRWLEKCKKRVAVDAERKGRLLNLRGKKSSERGEKYSSVKRASDQSTLTTLTVPKIF